MTENYDETTKRAICCWMCGQWTTMKVLFGETIGAMVYSSSICVSSEFANGRNLRPAPSGVELHMLKGGFTVCVECVNRLARLCGDVTKCYVEEHMKRHEMQLTEVADFDTGLVSTEKRNFPFGCWLKQFPDVDVRQRWKSLDLSTLFKLGYRLQGQVSFGEPEFREFVDRFCSQSGDSSPEFMNHLNDHISAPAHLLHRLVGMRATIFDVSIVLAQRQLISDPRLS